MAAPGLAVLEDTDWSLGIFRSADRRHIPPRGAYDIVNGLVDEDGKAYERGGVTDKTSAWGSAGLRWIWDGLLVEGAEQRTLVSDGARIGVIDAADAAVLTLPLPSGTPASFEVIAEQETDGVLFIALHKDRPLMYAGSRKTTVYSTGTVDLTDGDDEVVGHGTSWLANVDPGMLLRLDATDRVYIVKEVTSNTRLDLMDDYLEADVSGEDYTLRAVERADQDRYVSSKNKGDITALGVAAKRLMVADGNKVYFSKYDNPHVGWENDNHHALPQAVEVLGIMEVRGVALLFTTGGVWTLSGLLADITDDDGNPQHQLNLLSKDIILWGQGGLASWRGGVLCAAIDGLWLVGPGAVVESRNAPERLSNSITPLWDEHVRAGHQPGKMAVYRNHLFLPILSAPQGTVVDLLVCRLDRAQRVGGVTIWPWTRMAGAGAQMGAFAQRITKNTRLPFLLGADRTSRSRVVDASSYFEPAAGVKNDSDGTAPVLELVTRDYATGPNEGRNTVRRARLRYELVDAASDNPTLTAEWDDGTGAWTALSALAGSGVEDDGRRFQTWHVQRNGGGQPRCRVIRYRIRSVGPAAYLSLLSVQTHVRQSGGLR